MKKSRLFSSIVSSSLSILMLFSSFSTSYATNDDYIYEHEQFLLEAYEAEVSFDELIGNGIYAVLYYDDDTQSIAVYDGKLSDSSTEVTAKAVGTLHLGLTYNKYQGLYNLYWQISLYQLQYFKADLYCKNTSLFYPTYYYSNTISQTFDGSSSLGFGSTKYFSIPSDEDIVSIGWENCTLNSVTEYGYIANKSYTLNPADIRANAS